MIFIFYINGITFYMTAFAQGFISNSFMLFYVASSPSFIALKYSIIRWVVGVYSILER